MTLVNSSGGRSDGVPPPKKTEVAGPLASAAPANLSTSVRQAATYRSHICSRSVQVAKAQ